jgi:hypothetical protein
VRRKYLPGALTKKKNEKTVFKKFTDAVALLFHLRSVLLEYLSQCSHIIGFFDIKTFLVDFLRRVRKHSFLTASCGLISQAFASC